MASAFDPSAFIQAEIAARSQSVATESRAPQAFTFMPETAEIRQKPDLATEPLAKIATIAGVPENVLPWSDELRRFEAQECPLGVRPGHWDELVGEAVSISRRWGSTALNLGWSALDLFGCNPQPEKHRIDRDGLVVSIVGLRSAAQVVEITEEYATLLDIGGSKMRHRPRLRARGSVLLWEAYAMPAGP